MQNSEQHRLRAILIDDEQHSLDSLQYEIEAHCPEVEIIDACKGPEPGLESIRRHRPDLVFLDIEMPGMSGFEMLDRLPETDFDVIFTTAHDEYAIRAFRVSAMDYLLKPVDPEELIPAVRKVHEKRSRHTVHERLDVLMTNIRTSNFEKLAIPTLAGLDFVSVPDINYCKADGNYTEIHMQNGEKFLVSRTIKDMEELLSNPSFYRTHQSYLVNLNCIKKYIKGGGGHIVMQNGVTIRVSRQRREGLLEIIYRK